MKAIDSDTNIPAESYVIGPAFDLPELTTIRAVDWVDRSAPETISTTYYDTFDDRLARCGITLRRVEEERSDGWYATSAGLQSSLQLDAAPVAGAHPGDQALGGLTRGGELRKTLTMTTLRERVAVFDDDGQTLATIHVDRVSATGAGGFHVRRSWDTLELRFPTGEDADGAHAVRRALIEHGAIASEPLQRPERVLGVVPPERPRKLAGLIHDYLLPQLDRLLFNDIALRQGCNAAHETRVAIRRVLSVVRVMDDCFHEESARLLTSELTWFAGVLGIVTDTETRRKRLRKALTGANVAAAHLSGQAVVARELDLDRQVAILTLDDALQSSRYEALIDLVKVWRAATPYTAVATKHGKRRVKRYLERADAELTHRLGALRSTASDGSMHAARIAARRTRFVAELAQPAIGRPAAVARADAMEIQDRLGDHRDALITVELSTRLARTAEGADRAALASIVERMELDVEAARKRSLSATSPR